GVCCGKGDFYRGPSYINFNPGCSLSTLNETFFTFNDPSIVFDSNSAGNQAMYQYFMRITRYVIRNNDFTFYPIIGNPRNRLYFFGNVTAVICSNPGAGHDDDAFLIAWYSFFRKHQG